MSAADSDRIEQTMLIELPMARKDISMYIVNRKGFTCGDHAGLEAQGWYVSLIARVDCPKCHGDDEVEVCHDFCPVCEFCCGC